MVFLSIIEMLRLKFQSGEVIDFRRLVLYCNGPRSHDVNSLQCCEFLWYPLNSSAVTSIIRQSSANDHFTS